MNAMNQIRHQDLIKDLKTILEEQAKQVVFAYIFGSLVKSGSYRAGDIDLAVFFEKSESVSFLDAKLDLNATLSRMLKFDDIDILILNTARNLILLDEVIRDGIVILDKDPNFREDFEQRILHQALDFKYQRASILGV